MMKAIAFNGENYLIEKKDGLGCIYNLISKRFSQDHVIISLLSKGYWEWLNPPVEIDKTFNDNKKAFGLSSIFKGGPGFFPIFFGHFL